MTINILMPALSPTMTEGKLAKWLIGEGDPVNSGDIIAEIETDKATMEVEAVEEGTLGKIIIAEGTEGVPVNDVIAILLEDGDDSSSMENIDSSTPMSNNVTSSKNLQTKTPAKQIDNEKEIASNTNSVAPITAYQDKRIFVSPLARRMAAQSGLDLKAVSGTGPNGRIVKADVEAAISETPVAQLSDRTTEPMVTSQEQSTSDKSPFEPNFDLELPSTMRKTIARRLTESKQQIPHFYLTVDCEIEALLKMRKLLNDKGEENYKISVNDMIIKAAAIALRLVPKANASWTEQGVKLYKSADISVAVAIDGGLITPIIRQAERKGLKEISAEMKALSVKAREGKLIPEEYQGGTFSISNLGMYGIKEFSAVINPPQACILAIGVGEQRPIVKDGALAVATVMSSTLSVDHRAVDGAIGAEFLSAFKRLVEDPISMLL